MKQKSVYFMGIKGVAMTAMAVYFKEKGYLVTGSDVDEEFPTDMILKKRKIKILKGFSADNIQQKYDYVVVTGAHGGMTNIEAQKARELGIPTFMHGEMLGKLMAKKKTISISGCHGKTTTSAMVASLLKHSGFDPSFIIGTASINDLGDAGHFGHSDYFVAEADEYMTCPLTDKTPRFMWQNPQTIVVTNIDYDHPDAFSNIEEIKRIFRDFINKLPLNGTLIACIDDPNVRDILPEINRNVITYGFSPRADYLIDSVYSGIGASFMKISNRNMKIGEYMIKIPGRHNLLNALAASISANQLGIPWEKIKENLKFFTGTKRRFEKIGSFGSNLLFDDYAHHPSEITATLKAVRDWYPNKRLIVIFQPHTFSRTKALLPQFAKAFVTSDMAILTDIYASKREKIDMTINSKILVSEANKYKKNAIYKENKQEVLSFLNNNVGSNDLVITMGAGDIYLWQHDIASLLKTL